MSNNASRHIGLPKSQVIGVEYCRFERASSAVDLAGREKLDPFQWELQAFPGANKAWDERKWEAQMDRYSGFDELKRHEKEGVDYRIRARLGYSGIAILSIHGGDIEPGTSQIADAVAGHEHTFYALEGIKSSGNLALHIKSTLFDEPTILEILGRTEITLSIHGCKEKEPMVHIGGLDLELRRRILKELREAGFDAR